jgi:hypothetical protein
VWLEKKAPTIRWIDEIVGTGRAYGRERAPASRPSVELAPGAMGARHDRLRQYHWSILVVLSRRNEGRSSILPTLLGRTRDSRPQLHQDCRCTIFCRRRRSTEDRRLVAARAGGKGGSGVRWIGSEGRSCRGEGGIGSILGVFRKGGIDGVRSRMLRVRMRVGFGGTVRRLLIIVDRLRMLMIDCRRWRGRVRSGVLSREGLWLERGSWIGVRRVLKMRGMRSLLLIQFVDGGLLLEPFPVSSSFPIILLRIHRSTSHSRHRSSLSLRISFVRCFRRSLRLLWGDRCRRFRFRRRRSTFAFGFCVGCRNAGWLDGR